MVLKFGAGRGFGHSNRRSQRVGGGYSGPTIVNNSALDAFRTARTNRASAPCSILMVNDSWGEAFNCNPYTLGYVSKVGAALEAAFPTTGATALNTSTFIPANISGPSGGYGGQTSYTSKTGTFAFNPNGRDAALAAVGDSITYTINGDGFAIPYWNQPGWNSSITVEIDGVSQGTIVLCGPGDTAGGFRVTPRYAMSAGTHTVKISYAAGANLAQIYGLLRYYGNHNKGMRVLDMNRAGWDSGRRNHLLDYNNYRQAGQSDMTMTDSSLATLNFSLTNDYNNQTPIATFQSNVLATMSMIRASNANRPILLWAANAPNDQGAKAIPWTSYRDVYLSIAQADPTKTAFVDFSAVIPSAAADTGIWSFWDTDKLHPNPAGHATLAGLLAAVLSS